MRKIITTFLLLLILVNSNGQTFVLQDGDSTYQDRVIFDNGDSTNLWEFKPNLPKGQYWVIEPTECGPDTLDYAEFLDIGIKHGTWTEWESGLCFGTFKEETEVVDKWSFASEKEKYSETVYDSGFIVKSTLYHIGSNQPHWEHLYPDQATKENQWNEERIWREDGTLRWITEVNEDGTTQHEDFYPNGQIEAYGKFGKNGTFAGIWKYFYQNGQLKGKGEFESFNAQRYAGWRVPKGYWQYWDEQGQLIAEVTFKRGKPKKIKRHQNIDIPFPDVNEMMTKE